MKIFISLFAFLLFIGNTYAGKIDTFYRVASHAFYTFNKNPEVRDMVKEGRWGDLLTTFITGVIIFLAFVALLSIGCEIWTWNKDRQKKQNDIENTNPPEDAE